MDPALRGAAVIQGGQSRPPLQGRTGAVRNGTSRTPSPTMGDTNRAKRDFEDAVPYTLCHCEERSDAAIRSPPAQKDGFPRQCVPQGHLLRGAHWRGMTARCAVGTSRTPSPTKSQGMCAMGGRRHPPLQGKTGTAQNGTAGTPSPTHSVPRWERRDTWVPPYEVRRSSRADRVVRPYKAEQDPCKTGRRGRRPLRWGTRTAQSGTAGTACPTNRRGAARTAKFRNLFFPLSASAGLRRLYSDDTGRPPVL